MTLKGEYSIKYMKKFILISSFVLVGLFMFSSVSFAAADILPGTNIDCSARISNFTTLINYGTCTIIKAIIPLLVAVAVAAFVYGIIQYFLNPENEEKRKAGKSFMIWGIVTLFVMVSIWGLVGIFSSSFLPDSSPVIPGFPTN